MRLGNIKGKNFLSIGAVKTSFEFIHGKVIIYNGEIGSGKSTIIDMISVALFGKTYSKKDISSIINRTNKKQCEVELDFWDDNKNHYIIKRSFKPDKHSFSVKKDGEDKYEEVKYTRKKGLGQKIAEILNIDQKIFDQTVFISGKFSKPFLELNSTDKKDFIKRLFSLERYDKMGELIKDDVKSKKFDIATVNGKISSFKEQKEMLEKDIIERHEKLKIQKNEAEEKLKEVEKRIENIKNNLKEVDENSLKIIQKKKEQAKEQEIKLKNEIEILKKEQAEFVLKTKKLKDMGKYLISLKSDYNQLYVLSDDKYDLLREQCYKLSTKGKESADNIKEIKKRKDDYNEKKSRINKEIEYNENLFERLNEKIEKIKENHGKVLDLEKLEKEKERLQNIFIKEEIVYNKNLDEIQTTIEKIYQYSKSIEYYKNTNVCKECGNKITGEYGNNKIKELLKLKDEEEKKKEKIIEESKKQHSRKIKIEKIIKQIEKEIIKLKEYNKNIQELEEREKEYKEKLKSLTEEKKKLKLENWKELEEKENKFIKEYKKQIAEKIEKIDLHKKQVPKKQEIGKIEHEMKILEETIKEKNWNEQIDKNNEKMKEISMSIINIENDYDNLNKIIQENQKSKIEIIREENQLKIFSEKIYEYKKEIKTPDRRKIEEIENKIKEENKILLKLNDEIDLLEKLIVIVGEQGIKKYIIGKYLSMLNQICDKYLKAVDAEHGVSFNNKKGLDCIIIEKGQEFPYRNLSNGQSQRVNLAILFTFIEFLRIKSNNNFPLIFLDEMFDSSMSPEALKQALEQVKKNIPYVNIITHRAENLEMADKLIRVERRDGFSKYIDVTDGFDKLICEA